MRSVAIPAAIEQAIGDAVTRQLEGELGDRRLLLTADEMTAAETEAARTGTRLLTSLIHRCYPSVLSASGEISLDFGGPQGAARLKTALAFGAATARVLAPDPLRPDVEFLCATFNLGIGLVDSLCDHDAEMGGALLALIQAHDLVDAAEQRCPRGWLRATLPPRLADDPTAAFTADVIETFFETLHDVHPESSFRRGLGLLLVTALEAERASITPTPDATRDELLQYSRLTSVLPFQIIEALTEANDAPVTPTAGTQLGEAMWRIDDLVDLCQDARTGSLNSVLLAAGDSGVIAVQERLLVSNDLAGIARRAAEDLRAGLQRTRDPKPFLYFIQRYAGIAPR